MNKGLIESDYTRNKIDECVYYRNGTIILLDVDDDILAGPSKV